MPRPPLDPALLSSFAAVCEHGRISEAARALHLSQPALTARVQKLERSLGAPLLTRSVHGVEPTAAGLRLARLAGEVQGLLDEAVAELADGSRRWSRIALAASTTLAAHVLPSVVGAFLERHPGAEVEIGIGNTKWVLDQVRRGAAPLGLVEGSARAVGLRLEPWLDDRLVPVLSPSSRWRVRDRADLAQVPLLWRESGSGTRSVVARALRQAGLRSRPQRGDLVLASSEAIAGAAAAGLGLAFLSSWSVGIALGAGYLRAVPGLDLDVRRTFRWALPAGALAPGAEEFHRFASQNPPVG